MQLRSERRRRLRGFMLLEVLVAMLLSALAVVTFAGLHATATRAGKMTQARAMAGLLMSDLFERLRANRAGALEAQGASPYELRLDWAAQQALGDLTLRAGACEGPQASCSPLQFAQADLAQWRLVLARSLPLGAAHVQVDGTQALVDVWVAWREPGLATDEVPEAEPVCPSSLGAGSVTGLRCLHGRLKL